MRKNLMFYVLLLLITIACTSTNSSEKQGKVRIVATTGIIGDALINLLDTNAEITSLMGPGVDPHLYKATQGDLQRLNNADIVVYNGLHLEGKMVEILERLKERKTVYSMEEMLDKDDFIQAEGFSGNYDPHIWFDVSLWSKAVYNLGGHLADTLHFSNEILNNRDNYVLQLKYLHNAVKDSINSIPHKNKVLVTAHDAFEYFGRAYNIEVRGLQGISTLSEAGIKDITKLVNFLVENKIPAVFVETSVSRRSIDAVVEGCMRKGHPLKIGGYLYSDALGQAGSPEGSYIGTVRANVKIIVEALK
ncbi:zinc ABC transporter substrate-binding protein [Hyphobacterium sp. CCMP332]|nr:zinc ABC transporter substrate-binding protein [Hyphobacterium sp. CCMP332]